MSDSENLIFEPDMLIGAEFYAPGKADPSPERALMHAVLEEAARSFLGQCTATDRKQRARYEEARDWFASTDRVRLYDFATICDVLGFDADYVRRQMFAARDERRASGHRQPPNDVAPTARLVSTQDPDAVDDEKLAG